MFKNIYFFNLKKIYHIFIKHKFKSYRDIIISKQKMSIYTLKYSI